MNSATNFQTEVNMIRNDGFMNNNIIVIAQKILNFEILKSLFQNLFPLPLRFFAFKNIPQL